MRILIVASNNRHKTFAPFIVEQADSLVALGCEVVYFGICGKGIKGYYSNLKLLKAKIKEFKPDVIHAHYGLSGLLANMQRSIPVVTTYHGSDINVPKILRLSKMSMCLSAYNIFVSKKTLDIAAPKKKFMLLPCGVNLDEFPVISRQDARKQLDIPLEHKFVLFAGAFDNQVKNAPLAKAAMALIPGVELKECKGYTRSQVALLMNAADAFLMTSFTEGSPQVIKEAMACGCPIVSVDVGDVAEVTSGIDGCYISRTREPQELASLLNQALNFPGKTNGRSRIISRGLENRVVAEKLIGVYEGCLRQA